MNGRKFLIFFFTFLLCKDLQSQDSKRNNIWTVGYSPPVIYDFNSLFTIDTFSKIGPGLTFGTSNISDTNGHLLFFCNGFYIYDKAGWPIGYPDDNYDSINCPLGLKFRDYYAGDGFWDQMSLILPKKENSYYVFTAGMSDIAYDEWKKPNPPYDFRFDVLSYHIVDMDVNEGEGKIIEKNNILMKDARLSHNRMSAVRHANGRDWWLIKPHQTDQTYYVFLVKPDTIEGPIIRQCNFSMDSITKYAGTYGIEGQCAFSPDGNWFASTEAAYKGVFIYKFDRCTGTFTDYHFFKQQFFDTTTYDWSIGTCFSPNNKLVYLITGANIYQYELADTTLNSTIHISGPDTVMVYFPSYCLSYLASNDKLYIGNGNGTQNGMSYIDKPNERGVSCNFVPKGVRQPFTNLAVPPNLPFYGLGKLEGSPCDTIKPSIPINTAIKIYPNPASDHFTIELPSSAKKVQAIIYNMLGEVVLSQTREEIKDNKVELSVKHLASGLYGLRVNADGERFVSKFVKE